MIFLYLYLFGHIFPLLGFHSETKRKVSPITSIITDRVNFILIISASNGWINFNFFFLVNGKIEEIL